MLACPFCGAPETDRFAVEGVHYLVFRCMFTPKVDAGLTDAEIEDRFRTAFSGRSSEYFRGTCDALHVYVAKGEGARILTSGRGGTPAHDAP